MTQAFPLHWPPGQSRTPPSQRANSRFDTAMTRALDNVFYEIAKLGGRDIIVSTNQHLRPDGKPYAQTKKIEDPGVAIYFTLKGRDQVFACDRWSTIGDNIHAIGKTIEALRGINRWGTSTMVEAAFAGFTALPAPKPDPNWQEFFRAHGQAVPSTLTELSYDYRSLAKKFMDDEALLRQLNIMRDAARADLS